jgi:dihydrofolate reductase / thymidylate synthase
MEKTDTQSLDLISKSEEIYLISDPSMTSFAGKSQSEALLMTSSAGKSQDPSMTSSAGKSQINIIVAVSNQDEDSGNFENFDKKKENNFTTNLGIGLEGTIPWHCKEELEIFKKKTLNNVIIVGRKTMDTLPFLKDRIIYCISRKEKLSTSRIKWKNECVIFKNISDAYQDIKRCYPYKQIYVCGGSQIYKEAMKTFKTFTLHISFMKKEYPCDSFFYFDLYDERNLILEINKQPQFSHYVIERTDNMYNENQYLNLVREILYSGDQRTCRKTSSTSINSVGTVLSSFAKHLKFDLRNGFPLLTTKKMFIRGVIEEFLFFIRGETNSKLLENKGINIWKNDTRRDKLDSMGKRNIKEGIMGPMYGYQWRHFNAEYDPETGRPVEGKRGIDQLLNVIDLIRLDPTSRRIILTSYNPSQVDEGVLYPCHTVAAQFYVSRGYLDMFCFNRSQDVGLGVPFNIASSALLLTMIAMITNLKPRFLDISLGDTHIYLNHLEALEEQVERLPFHPPTLEINKEIKTLSDIENLTFEDFKIKNYIYHPSIRMVM